MSRKSLFLLLLGGLAAGVAAGLALGWLVWPVSTTAVTPAALQDRYRQDYVYMIAAQYAQDADHPHAQQQLARLGADWQTLLVAAAAADAPSARLASDLGLMVTRPTPTPASDGEPDD